MTTDQLLTALRTKGLRLTPIRRRVIESFTSTTSPLSAKDLLRKVSANKTTIYRELATLLRFKVIVQIQLGDNLQYYELSSLDHHHHLVCLNCRSISDITLKEDLSHEESLIQSQTQFHILHHNLEFFGLCQKCFN